MQTYHHPRETILALMNRTSGRLSDAVLAAAFGRPEHEFRQIANDVASEARQLLISIEGLSIPAEGFISDNPYVSKGVPEGYETVYGYMEMVNPGYLDIVRQSLREAYRWEERKLRALASRRKIAVCEVAAPGALRDEGVETVTAYPVSLILEVLY